MSSCIDSCNESVEYARFQRVEVRGHHNIPDGVYLYRGRPANSHVYHMLTTDLTDVSDAIDPDVYLVTNSALDKSVSPYVENPEVGQVWESKSGVARAILEVTDHWVVCVHSGSLGHKITHAYATVLDEFKKTHTRVA